MKSKAVILNNCSIKSTEISNSRGSETNGFSKTNSTYMCVDFGPVLLLNLGTLGNFSRYFSCRSPREYITA